LDPTKRPSLGRAVGLFVRDLLAGDPVAVTVFLLLVAFVIGLGIAGFFFVRGRKRQQESLKRLRRQRNREEDERYKKMTDTDL
jgi:hypothetical protein